MAIPIYYDPMIAKLITYGNDREAAIQKMIRAIDEYQITGVQTTLPFCRFVMEHDAFRSGQFDTGFVGQYFTPEVLTKAEIDPQESELAAVLATYLLATQKPKENAGQVQTPAPSASRWRERRLG
jgi:propionyl-CoA carboxylase alpha chain